MNVISKLKVLLSEKELQEGRKLGIRTVAEESGANVSTVQRLMNNRIKRVPLDELAQLCRYLRCQVGDILVYIPDAPDD